MAGENKISVTSPTGTKVKISFDQLLTRSYWTFRRNPVLVVPTMLQTSLQVISQALVFIPGLVLLFQLLRSGRLQELATAASKQQFGQIATILGSPDFLGPILFFMLVVGIGLAIVNVVGGGILAAGEFGTYAAVVEGGGSVSTGTIFRSMSRLWRGLVLTELVYSVIVFGPVLLGLGLEFLGLALALGSGFSGIGGLVLLLVGVVGLFLGGVASLVLAIFGVYTFPAAVLEGKVGLAAYRRSYRIARDYTKLTLSYVAVRVVAAVAVVAVGILSGYIGVPLSSMGQALVTFFLLPLMHLSKTSMYNDIVHGSSLEAELVAPSVKQDMWRGIRNEGWALMRRGLRELVRYVFNQKNLVFHVVSVLVFVFGIYLGVVISSGGLGDILRQAGIGQPGHQSALAGLSPVPLGLDIFFHNWQVAIAVELSGLGLIVPSAVSMVLNGVILGVLAGVVPRLSYLLAGILPHGVIELPSFFVAGSIGLKLGWFAVRSLAHRNAGEDAALAGLLGQAVLVAVGLAPLFFVAGLIEALVTPGILAKFG